MPDQKITDLGQLTAIAAGDWLVVVDVSDGTMAPTGTDKRIAYSDLTFGLLKGTSNLADLADAAQARTNLGLGTAAVADQAAFDPAGAAAGVQTNLDTHTSDKGNPHAVTAAQAGAYTTGQVDDALAAKADDAAVVHVAGDETVTGAKTFSSPIVGSVTGTAAGVTGTVAVGNGGTGATTAAGARTALGLGTAAVADTTAFDAAGAAAGVLPAQAGQAGKYLTTDGTGVSWAAVSGGGGGSSSGAAGLVQISGGSGAFSSVAGLGWDATNTALDVPGGITFGPASGATLAASKEIVIKQTGDVWGPSALHLQNRDGVNGALFDTTGSVLDLVDFVFKSSGTQKNIRLENRSGSAQTGVPSFQIGDPVTPSLSIGPSYSGFSTRLAVGVFTDYPTTQLTIDLSRSNWTGLRVRANASQTEDLAEFCDSSNNFLSGVDSAGRSVFKVVSADPSDTPGHNGACCFNATNNKLWIYNSGWKSVTLL